MFINDAYAQASGAISGSASAGSTIIQLVLIFIIFYFLLIRPQQKKMKEHTAMLMAIKEGDKIVTGGGVIGMVEKASAEILEVSIADNVSISVLRSSVRDIANDIVTKKTTPSKTKAPKAEPKKSTKTKSAKK